eukprot:4051924-Alexandrium_andersonii.AAC.1
MQFQAGLSCFRRLQALSGGTFRRLFRRRSTLLATFGVGVARNSVQPSRAPRRLGTRRAAAFCLADSGALWAC